MKQFDLNELPEKLQSGELTEKETVNQICRFVAKNYPIYGLHKYDEDFRQEILLFLVERSPHILRLYNPNQGDFFTFLYCYICTAINSKTKSRIAGSMKDKINMEECITDFDDKERKYHKIDYNSFEVPKAPFAPKKIPPEEIQQSLKELSLKGPDKKVIILALKSSYYLTDQQINKICRIYGIKTEYFYSMVQHCKDSLSEKSIKRSKAEERRNFAYYHHKRYSKIIQNLNEDLLYEKQNIKKSIYSKKEKKHFHNWNSLNNAFEKGHLYLRPTNKTVANIMGICERQVTYYINCAKKEQNQKDVKQTGEA